MCAETSPAAAAATMLAKVREHVCNTDCGVKPTEQWYCPTQAHWCDCPGPCPDGTPHEGPSEREVFTHVIH